MYRVSSLRVHARVVSEWCACWKSSVRGFESSKEGSGLAPVTDIQTRGRAANGGRTKSTLIAAHSFRAGQ
ncbi:hypothetical protein CEXT_314801 [Caerostris extrusa]|uniref:Uncharacterized protein n=1 Tax=Caerostris extrusa TaxID=172846 RepID=A0AAV4N7J4_CAEEX|nr:hypothetical protein CEXT_314801 [Caerostris extrusa]